MSDENLTPNSLPGGDDVAPAGGEGTVESQDAVAQAVSQAEVANIKDVLGSVLGKSFPSDEAALKAVKDTFAFVGKAGQKPAPAPQAPTTDLSEVNQKIADLEFYNEHPDLKPYKQLISKFGNNPSEVIANPEAKSFIDKVRAADEMEKSKSVLHSNPRLGQVKDKLEDARSLLAEADKAAAVGNSSAALANQSKARSSAVGSVIDAYELR